MRQNYIRLANAVITDNRLYPSTKRVFTAMLAYCGRHGAVRRTAEELAVLSGCSPATVRQATAQLQELGYLRRIRCYRYSCFYRRSVFDTNTYYIRQDRLDGSYTLIPRKLLAAPISPSTFVVALYIYKTAGRIGRSWASLRAVAGRLDLSRATICRALKLLRELQLLSRVFCLKVNHAYSCNSYYPTSWVRPGGASEDEKIFLQGGGLIFSEHQVINKITEGFIKRERKKGVGQFGKLHSFWMDNLLSDPYFFDGVGVKVSTQGEPSLTG